MYRQCDIILFSVLLFTASNKLPLLVSSECSYCMDIIFICQSIRLGGRNMVFNATFNKISIISWWSVLLVEETGVPGETNRPAASHWQSISLKVVSGTHRLHLIRTHDVSGLVIGTHHIACTGFELTTLVVIGTDGIGSYKSARHNIKTTTAPESIIFGFLVTYAIIYNKRDNSPIIWITFYKLYI